jgi:hypothetical protein
MSEFWSSFSKWFSEKASSPLYWTYFGFFVAWNWIFFQVIFLEDASLFTRPRIEYLNALSLTPFDISAVDWVINVAWHVLPPVLFTYIAIVYLPRLHKWAFEIYLVRYFERKTMFQERKAEYEKKMTKLTKQEAVAKKERAEQEKIIERTKTEEEKWDIEYEKFENGNYQVRFQHVLDCIYEHRGITYNSYNGNRYLSAEDLSLADSWGLVTYDQKESRITLTDKGKYFAKKNFDINKN